MEHQIQAMEWILRRAYLEQSWDCSFDMAHWQQFCKHSKKEQKLMDQAKITLTIAA